MTSVEQREYNRIIQQRCREREKQLIKEYQDLNISGITFTEYKNQRKLTKWQKLSKTLSDEELRVSVIAFKLSDENIRSKFNKKNN